MERDVALGIDVGGTAVKLGLVDGSGRLLASDLLRTAKYATFDEALESIEQVAQALSAAAGAEPKAVGLGCAGLVGPEGRLLSSPNLPGWEGTDLASGIRDRFHLPAAALNDANAFVLAEARVGAAAGRDPVVGLTLGTGVGGGLIVSGRLLTGARGFAGEIGHMVLDPGGPQCACGQRGCLEALVGTRAFIEGYSAAGGRAPVGVTVDPPWIEKQARQGDPAALRVFEQVGYWLGTALINLANLLDPEVFVLGGGLAKAGDLLFEPVRRRLKEGSMAAAQPPAVLPARLGEKAGVVGAALEALDVLGA